MASHFLSVPSNLRTVALDSQTFAGSPRGAKEERHARMDTGKCNIEFPQGLQGVGVPQPLSYPLLHPPSDKSTSWGSEVRAIYINLITRNDVTSASSKTVPPQPPRIPRHRCSRLRTFFRLFPRPFLQPRASYTPARKTDLRYMIGGKKLLSRPRS